MMAIKKSTTARTTISVPMALKRRMEELHEPINWSAVAAAAFEAKLAEIATRKEKKTMSDVIERLRGSKRKSDTVDYRDGEAAGRGWAMHRAETVQLESLADFFAGLRGYDRDLVFDPVASAFSAAESVFSVIEPDCANDRDAARCFWESVLGQSEQVNRPEFLRGFVEGALGIWSEVRDQL